MAPVPICAAEAKRLLDSAISDLFELSRDDGSFLLSASIARLEILRD